MQFLDKVVELPLLCNDRCWVRQLSRGGTAIAVLSTVVDIPVVVVQTVHGEVPQLQFFDSRRNSSCAAVAVFRQSSKFQLWRRGSLRLQTARKPSTFHGCSFFHSFRSELITQVRSSCTLVSVTDVASLMFCDHTHPSSSLRNNNNNSTHTTHTTVHTLHDTTPPYTVRHDTTIHDNTHTHTHHTHYTHDRHSTHYTPHTRRAHHPYTVAYTVQTKDTTQAHNGQYTSHDAGGRFCLPTSRELLLSVLEKDLFERVEISCVDKIQPLLPGTVDHTTLDM